MYPISNAVKALFESEQRQVLRITGTDKNGRSINITDANVALGGFNIDRYSCNGERLEIGTAIAAEMTLKLDNRQGQYNNIVFEGTELFVEIGIADWSQSVPSITYIPCGYFTPDEQPRSLSTITIHALDRMVRFDTVAARVPWTNEDDEIITDGQGNDIEFLIDIEFPATVQSIITRMASLLGIPFTQSITNLPNYNFTIAEKPDIQQQCTFRNLLQWCAGIMGCNAWIDWTGSLRFSWYNNSTSYVTTTANRFISDIFENNITITGVQYTNTQDVTIVSGSDTYTLDMTGNYLAAARTSTILASVKNAVNGFTYRPFSASVINAPYLWPMDIITFNKDGNNYTCALTNVNFGINGMTLLEGKGETNQVNKGTSPNGMTNEQGFLVEKAVEETRQLDKSLTQEEIFNRLTNNGEEQGVILYNGKIYINAEYIQSSTIVANLLMAGVLTIGGADNGDGSLTVKNASGDIIGTWDKNGITIYDGEILADVIKGGTLNLGGYNNINGILYVKDADGNTIGTWNNAGIDINGGQIAISTLMSSSERRGFFVGSAGSFAVGIEPDSLGDFTGNQCGFQVSTTGDAKLSNTHLYSADNNEILVERMQLVSGTNSTYGDYARFRHDNGNYTYKAILTIGEDRIRAGSPFYADKINVVDELYAYQIMPYNNIPLDIYYIDQSTKAITISQNDVTFKTSSNSNALYIGPSGVVVTGEDFSVAKRSGDGGNLAVAGDADIGGNVDISGNLNVYGNVTGIANRLTFVQRNKQNMNVYGAYIQLGRTVTFMIEIELMGASESDLTDLAYGFPPPMFDCNFMVSVSNRSSGATSNVNVMKCAIIDTYGYMSLVGSYDNAYDTIYVTGSYISQS